MKTERARSLDRLSSTKGSLDRLSSTKGSLDRLSSTKGIGRRFQSLIALLMGALIIIGYSYQKGGRKSMVGFSQLHEKWDVGDHEPSSYSYNSLQGCNLFSGKWVFDESYPLYKAQKCEFMLDDFACDKYGRKDSKYQQWRWQPHDCDLPRFDATALLEKLRGKRLVFVGDSLNRNQWVSLVCLVESSIPAGLKSSHLDGSLFTFKATEYNASIDFYWAPFLVESNCDDPIHHRVQHRIVRIQKIESHARHWIDADLLVFDSYIWWYTERIKVMWGLSAEKSTGTFDVQMLTRFEMGLKTWADWLEAHVNRTRTKMFFASLSPFHNMGEEWGVDANQNCYNETEPIFRDGFLGTTSDPKMMRAVEETIDRLAVKGVKVHLLNITQLSDYRKDGHVSIHRRQWANLTEEQLSNPQSYADCAHWCLPGVPDIWNELLYAYLFNY